MNELEDIKLKILLQEMELESPNKGFTTRVMDQIFNENIALERIKSERILGKGFWIIIFLFAALLVVYLILNNAGVQPESQVDALLPEMNTGISNGIQLFLEKIGGTPLSIAGILAASSILLFVDRFITSNSRIFARTNSH